MEKKIIENYVDWDVYEEMTFDEDGAEVVDYQYVRIDNLYVNPSMRGQGIAKKLMDEAIAEIQAKYPGLPIKIVAEPGEDSVDQSRLIAFYAKYPVEVVAV